jgi:hypothetical protein
MKFQFEQNDTLNAYEGKKVLKNINATKAVTSILGILVGLAGVEHGFFEMLQGMFRQAT